jgi:hypothetical protein
MNAAIGNNQSIKYVVDTIQRHNHSPERWFAAALVPVGETHVADSIDDSSTPFQANGGNDAWGAWVQILGSADAGGLFFDLHKILFVDNQRDNTTHKVQIAFGETGAGAKTAGDYTEFIIRTQTGIANLDPTKIQSQRIAAGTKIWARVWAIGQISGTLDFFYGIHEYDR